MLERHLTPVVRESIDAFRIVEIQGARQTGKTTLAQLLTTEYGGRFVSLDDPLSRASAGDDPLASSSSIRTACWSSMSCSVFRTSYSR